MAMRNEGKNWGGFTVSWSWLFGVCCLLLPLPFIGGCGEESSHQQRRMNPKVIQEMAEHVPIDDPVGFGNFEAVRARLDHPKVNYQSPMVIQGTLVIEDGKARGLSVLGVDGAEPVADLVLIARKPDGMVLTIIATGGRGSPDDPCEIGIGVRAILMNFDSIAAMARKTHENEYELVRDMLLPVPVPDDVPVAIGVRDNSGMLSNFIPMRKMYGP